LEEIYQECARSYIDLATSSRYSRVAMEIENPEPGGRPGDELDVYVKSVYELSIDEIPIIEGIIKALSHRRLNIYDYESIDKERGRHVIAARLLEKAVKSGRSFIMVLPSALPLGLASSLPGDLWWKIEDLHVANVTVEYDNLLYLPTTPVDPPISLVAKRNSQASYERVQWLARRALELGLPEPHKVFLDSNKMIFDYVTLEGVPGLKRRIPVNKLAGHIVALDNCLGLRFTRPQWRRGETVSHLIYAQGLVGDELEALKREIERFSGQRPLLRGVLYDYYRLGAMRIQALLFRALGLA